MGALLFACSCGTEAVEPAESNSADPADSSAAAADEQTEAGSLPDLEPAMGLTLLATLTSPNEPNKATIRDADAQVVATFLPGDTIRSGLSVVAVEDGVVVLERQELRFRLTMKTAIAELAATDAFYPDLADDLVLPNAMGDAIALQPGPGYVVKRPTQAWATPRTINALRDAIRRYHQRVDGAPDVHVGDLSLRSGGPFPPHLSHQDGRDVDIGYVLEGSWAHEVRFVSATPTNLDRSRTWTLIEALLKTDRVAYIFMDYGLQKLLYEHSRAGGVEDDRLGGLFQYPRGPRAAAGVIRHWPGHENHFHVRFAR